MRSFEAVTGPKQDDWLVRTVGLLVTVIGLVMLRHRGAAVRDLGAGSALALGAVDVVGVASGRLWGVYLLDAVVEAAIVTTWLAPLIRLRAAPTARAPRAPSPAAPRAAR
jgi:hypothetical protein